MRDLSTRWYYLCSQVDRRQIPEWKRRLLALKVASGLKVYQRVKLKRSRAITSEGKELLYISIEMSWAASGRR
jgi:hypothetical protein